VRTRDVIEAACTLWRIDRDVLLGRSRVTGVVVPRQAAMVVARRLTGESYPELGRRFGGRDHTTVLHAAWRAETYRKLQAAVAELMAALPTVEGGARGE
jgi:chromosomal replication initiator protein